MSEEIKLNDHDIERINESLNNMMDRKIRFIKQEVKEQYKDCEENMFMTNITKIICYSAIGLAGTIGISVIVNTLLKGALQ